MLSNNRATKHVYRMMLGTSGRQWEQLTVKDDGTMMLYFHGTDRSVTQQVTLIEDGEWKGWLKSEKGSMWPGIESGRWQKVSAAEVESAEQEQCAERFAREDVPQPTPRPHRQRKPRRPSAAVEPLCRNNVITESQNDKTAEPDNYHAWLRSAGYLAAASVALVIIYQTGLLIPLGLIGLATGGLLK